MKTKITKLLSLLFTCVMLATALCLPSAATEDTSKADSKQYTASDVLKPTLTAYWAVSNFNGLTRGTDLSPEDVVDVKVTDHGGVTKDGRGNLVFSNYATLSISFNTKDSSMEIVGTDATVVSERSYSYDGKYVGKSKKQELKKKVGYGAIVTSRASADGDREIFEPLFAESYGVGINELRLTKDGDYHVVILLTVKESGVKKKIAIEYVIPIRTKLYITDEAGEYHVKDEGAYYDAVKLDALQRPDVMIKVNDVTVPDGYVLREKGVYNIKVYGNGYLCENLNFEIFSKDDEHAYIYLANSRKQLDSISYECESYFSVRWSSNRSTYMTYWKDSDPEKTYNYTSGEKLTEVGTYVFTLHIPSLSGEEKTFLVNLVENDDPTVNYNTLHANRFNNFKTKWYEVYDEANDNYYCFAMNEYVAAYDAAMTLERAGVVDYGMYYTYKNMKYTDKILLTEDINKNAEANIKEVYYDPADERIEKYFSDRNFDGTVYLNPDFQFVRTSPAETDKVTLISPRGEKINVSFFTPISTYKLDSGVYTVVEEDRYGNKTEYSCVVDKIAPEITISLNGKDTEAHDKMTYTGRYFALGEIIDELDPYAVVSVDYGNGSENRKKYFYRDECNGAVFFEPGFYTVRVYDRNGNETRLTFNIPDEKQYSLTVDGKGAKLVLKGENVEATAIVVNGTHMSDLSGKREWSFEARDEYVEYIVTTIDKVTGETDYLYFVTEPIELDVGLGEGEENMGDSSPEKDGKMSLDSFIIIISITGIVVLAACIFILIKVWRRGDE